MPEKFYSKQEQIADRGVESQVGIEGRAKLLLSLLLAIEQREFLVFTDKVADEAQPSDLFCREHFIVWDTRACSKLSMDVTEPFKFSAYHCFSFVMGWFEYIRK